MTPAQYYVLSIGWQLERKGDDNGDYTRAFVVLYAASAALAPIGGAVADKYGVGFAQGLATALTGSSFVVLLSDSLPAQIAGMTLYSIGRLFVFALFFSNIGEEVRVCALRDSRRIRDVDVGGAVHAAVPDVHAGHRRECGLGERGVRGGDRRVPAVHRVAVQKGTRREEAVGREDGERRRVEIL